MVDSHHQPNHRSFLTLLIIVLLVLLVPSLIRLQQPSTPLSSATLQQRNELTLIPLQQRQEQDGQEVAASSSASSSSSSAASTLPEFMSFLLSSAISSDWKNVFDVDVLLASQQHQSQQKLFDEVNFPCYEEMMQSRSWDMKKGLYEYPRTPPSCVGDLTSLTKSLNYFISIGLSRIAYDKSLGNLYVKLQQQQEQHLSSQKKFPGNKLDMFELKIAQMIVSYLQSASIGLQIWIDSSGSLSSSSSPPPSSSSSSSSPSTVLEALRNNRPSRFFKKEINGNKKKIRFDKNKVSHRWLLERSSLIVLHPFTLKWEAQVPVNGRFWNNFRATLPCSSLHRTCENPEGCRFLCNFEYSLAKATEATATRRRKAVDGDGEGGEGGYSIVGVGSNNQFEWEDSMIMEFERRKRRAANLGESKEITQKKGSDEDNDNNENSPTAIRDFAPGLASITTFDCTLLTRPNPGVRPSATVRKIKERFRFVPFCLTGGRPDDVVNFGNDQTLLPENNNNNHRSMNEIFESKEASSKSISMAELRMVLDWKDDAMKKQKRAFSSSSSSSSPPPPTKTERRSRKIINLLKIDIESFEYISLSRWLQLDLYQIYKQQQQAAMKTSKSAVSIDFEKFPFLEVEQLQIELHRRGHKKDVAAGPVGAMWLLWLQLTMYGLGFMPVVAEKNHYDNCCFEQVLVHYRFFVESELSLVA